MMFRSSLMLQAESIKLSRWSQLENAAKEAEDRKLCHKGIFLSRFWWFHINVIYEHDPDARFFSLPFIRTISISFQVLFILEEAWALERSDKHRKRPRNARFRAKIEFSLHNNNNLNILPFSPLIVQFSWFLHSTGDKLVVLSWLTPF